MPVLEWLAVNEELRTRLRSRGVEAVNPAVSLEQCACDLVASGMTTSAEYERLFGTVPNLKIT
jgi:hypothetical protein